MILTKPFNVNLSYTEGIKSFATFLFVLFSRLVLVNNDESVTWKIYIFYRMQYLVKHTRCAVHTLDFITIVSAHTDQGYPLL